MASDSATGALRLMVYQVSDYEGVASTTQSNNIDYKGPVGDFHTHMKHHFFTHLLEQELVRDVNQIKTNIDGVNTHVPSDTNSSSDLLSAYQAYASEQQKLNNIVSLASMIVWAVNLHAIVLLADL
jgi:hypothetical protein